MKKQLLFASAILVTGMVNAQVSKKANRIPANIANVAIPSHTNMHEGEASVNNSNNTTVATQPSTPIMLQHAKIASATTATIGTTFYDLQTNSSVGDRIVVNADGTIATCWTYSSDAGKVYVDRGTGYNYFDGTVWGAAPTARIEGVKVGWGNVVNTRTGKELILAHYGGGFALNVASRAMKGTGAWANSTTAIPSANAGGNFWPRMVSTGDTVYAIALTSPPSGGGTAYMGLNGAIVFSRSKDAGATWDIINAIPNGLDATKSSGFRGDNYAIAAKGSTVVIAAGGHGRDVTLVKSTDAGTTWTYTQVRKFAIPHYDEALAISDSNGDNVADTLSSNDGSLAVGLDNTNQAYVFYGLTRVLCTAVGSPLSYFPGTDGLMMWKESFQAGTDSGGVMIAAVQDLYGDNHIFFPTPAASGDFSFGTFGTGLTSFPSVAFDASNTMYLSYGSVVDSLMSLVNSTKLVRHTYLIKSTDGGMNWTEPCDLVGSPVLDPSATPYEGVFASMAKKVNGYVHLIYQKDLGPGDGIPGTASLPNKDQADNTTSNDIVYMKIPVGDIGTCAIVAPSGVKELSSSVSNLNFYPNPATSNGTIEVVLNETAKMDIAILNSVGQTVYSTSVSANVGSNKVDVNLSNLSSGLYFYQVKVANSKSITKKFVIEK